MQASKQGRHVIGSTITISWPFPLGWNQRGSVGPKEATTLHPAAAAMCMTPLSTPKKISQTESRPFSARKFPCQTAWDAGNEAAVANRRSSCIKIMNEGGPDSDL